MKTIKFLKNEYLRTWITQNRLINTKMPHEKSKEDGLFNANLKPYIYNSQARSNANLIDKLPNAINFWLKIPQDKLDAIREVINHAGHGILLFDDVQDYSLFRRNLPASYRIFGMPLTVNSSIYLIVEGCMKTFSLGHPMAPEVYCKNIKKYWEASGLDIYWRDNYICPTEDEYKAVQKSKCGRYIGLQLELMQLFSDNKTDYLDFFLTLGLYYQIRDDYFNLVKVADLEEKSRLQEFNDLKDVYYCEDITEGKFTWPMIHALKTHEAPTIRSILIQRTRDVKIKQHCLSLLEKVGSLEFTLQTLIDMDRKLREQVEQLDGNPILIAYLDEMNNWNKE